jgi:hypothetical protein
MKILNMKMQIWKIEDIENDEWFENLSDTDKEVVKKYMILINTEILVKDGLKVELLVMVHLNVKQTQGV